MVKGSQVQLRFCPLVKDFLDFGLVAVLLLDHLVLDPRFLVLFLADFCLHFFFILGVTLIDANHGFDLSLEDSVGHD